MGERSERLRRKREVQRKRDAARRDALVQAAEQTADDLGQAVVRRKATVSCPALGGDLKFTALSISEQGELKEEALRYFRRDQLRAKIDELTVMKESGLITQEQFDQELNDARQEVRVYSFDDMPRMDVEFVRDGKKVRMNVEYERFFMSATKDGQVMAVLVALRTHHPDITRSQLERVMSEDPDFFIAAADEIQEITNSLIAKKSARRM